MSDHPTRASASDPGPEGGGYACIVCIDNEESARVDYCELVPCAHRFDLLCLLRYINESKFKSCPLCSEDLIS